MVPRVKFGGHQFRVVAFANPLESRVTVRASILEFTDRGRTPVEVAGETAAVMLLDTDDEATIWKLISDFAAEQAVACTQEW